LIAAAWRNPSSTGRRSPVEAYRRIVLRNASIHTKAAEASSDSVFQWHRSSSWHCIFDQNDSVIGLSTE
jgi:hypothetical protein